MVDRLAQKAYFGGEQSLPKESQELEMRFGEMRRGLGETRLAMSDKIGVA
jgi:hypothetical protein